MIEVVKILSKLAQNTGKLAHKRQLLFNEFIKVVDADYWMCGDFKISASERQIIVNGASNLPFISQAKLIASVVVNKGQLRDPLLIPMQQRITSNELVTATRQELISDQEWYQHEYYLKFRKPTHLDQALYSLCPTKNEHYTGAQICRKTGRPPFTEKDRQIFHLLLEHTPWINFNALPEDHIEDIVRLSPRLYETFLYITVQGWSNKQIAEEMSLSIHTVNGYVENLKMHFLATTKTELMANANRLRVVEDKPKLH